MKVGMDPSVAIGILGGGLIGMGWAVAFSASGRDVIIYDTDPNTRSRLDKFVANIGFALDEKGAVKPLNLIGAVKITDSLKDLSDVEFIQECLPERLELKKTVLRELENVIRRDTIIASSTSGISISDIQSDALVPERILGGHPFNPVYLLPLVEIAGGSRTQAEFISAASSFYAAMGRQVCILNKDIRGFIANRLSRAVWREALHLLQEGVANIETIDRAMRFGPGLRWATQGPFEVYHCAGGTGGISHFFSQFAPAMQSGFNALGAPTISQQLISSVIEEVSATYSDQSIGSLETMRDMNIASILGSDINRNK